MGIVEVASLAARVSTEPPVTITSTLDALAPLPVLGHVRTFPPQIAAQGQCSCLPRNRVHADLPEGLGPDRDS